MKAKHCVMAAMALLLIAVPMQAQQNQDWSFSGASRIEIEGLSGDVVVQRASGSEVVVELESDVRPAGNFRAEVGERNGTIRISENWSRGNSRGPVAWTISIPASMEAEIDFETASGDLEISGVSVTVDLSTASGDLRFSDGALLSDSAISTASGDLVLNDVEVGDDVEMSTASGDVELTAVHAGRNFEFSTASGDVEIEASSGVLEGSTASGNVRVSDTELNGPSHFSSASGDVIVRLSAQPEHDLEASSASGDVRLETAFGSNFTLVMIKRQDRGSIDSPFAFTSEDTFRRNGRIYEEKTVERGSGGPKIIVRTASGSVEVRNRR